LSWPLTVIDNYIYIINPREIFALNLENGKKVWSNKQIIENNDEISIVKYSNEKIYIYTDNSKYIFCVDKNTGKKIWKQNIDAFWYSFGVYNDKLFFGNF